MTDLYKYHLRPAYKSEELLIEIFTGVDKPTFLEEFIQAIWVMEPNMEEVKDLWFNDEVMFTIRTKFGDFDLSKDIWGLAFLMSKNQESIMRINSLLEKNEKFTKVEVDHEKYK